MVVIDFHTVKMAPHIAIRNFKFYSILIISLQTVKWLQVYVFNTNYSTEHYSGVMVIVVGNGHSDTSSNPGQDW